MSLCGAAKALGYFRLSGESGQNCCVVVFGHHTHCGLEISLVDSTEPFSWGRTDIPGDSAVICNKIIGLRTRCFSGLVYTPADMNSNEIMVAASARRILADDFDQREAACADNSAINILHRMWEYIRCVRSNSLYSALITQENGKTKHRLHVHQSDRM